MPKINGRNVGYSRTGLKKAKRAKAAGMKVSGLTRRTAAGGGKKKAGAARKASKAGGANVMMSKYRGKTAKMAAGKKAHYAGMKKPNKALRTKAKMLGKAVKVGAGKAGGKRKMLGRARAAGKTLGKTAQQRARKYTKR